MQKNHSIENLEVLAPAGNMECFHAALNAGADAIYLGLSSFNARMKADNFTEENIRDVVKLAHTFGTKIYVTVNILFNDDDFEKLGQMIQDLIDAKVDAFIVQDLGVALFLKESFEGIILHASTQMGIHNLAGAVVAEKLGFSRVVLSRETKLEDIKQIKQNTNLEIEYFVQGALCVAFSGNCYLSALEKNASGNAGKCLQLCRLPNTNNLTNETAYHLSTRDLSLLENLQELIDAGVTSFKIEGRMRHAGYTATTTSIYKQALKNLGKTKDFSSMETSLKTTYSRGDFNKKAYLDFETPNNLVNKLYQNHIGIKIGTVKKVEPFKNNLFKVWISSNHELSAGDGLKIINSKTHEQISSLGIGNVEKISNDTFVFYTKNKFSAGLDVHLTQDSSAEEKILKNTQKIPIKIKINAFSNQDLIVEASTNEVVSTTTSSIVLQKATNKPISKEDFEIQFSKLAESPFVLENLTLETDGIFLPKSLINDARRTMVQALADKLIFENEKHLPSCKFKPLNPNKIISTPANISIINKIPEEISSNTIYVFEPENYLTFDILEILSKIPAKNLALSLPVISNHADQKILNKIIEILPKESFLYVQNVSGLFFAMQGKNVIASPLLNIKNTFAANLLNRFNITTICASIEADDSFIKNNNLIAFAEGNFPMMTFAHCPFKTIFDNDCKNCKYSKDLTYTFLANTYSIKRTKLNNCYFSMQKRLNLQKNKFFITNLI